ncbi:hypothetical protein L4D09_18320 [Photobacterium makurazakiensis]
MDFTEKMKLRGKAEEDLYFAERDRKLIDALHEQQSQKLNKPMKKNSME